MILQHNVAVLGGDLHPRVASIAISPDCGCSDVGGYLPYSS